MQLINQLPIGFASRSYRKLSPSGQTVSHKDPAHPLSARKLLLLNGQIDQDGDADDQGPATPFPIEEAIYIRVFYVAVQYNWLRLFIFGHGFSGLLNARASVAATALMMVIGIILRMGESTYYADETISR